MDFEQMNAIQRRLHNAACVLGADGDDHGFKQLQHDAIDEIERLRAALAAMRPMLDKRRIAWKKHADYLDSVLGPNGRVEPGP